MAKKPAKKPVKRAAKKPAKTTSGSPLSNLKPWQKLLVNHGLVILGFYLLVAFFFKPIVFDGKVLNQEDSINYKGLSHQSVEYRAETGEEPLWNANIFSGMPAYQAGTKFSGNWFFYLEKYVFRFGLPRPASYIFLTFVGFYFLLLTLNLGPWMSAVGAIAYALSSYWFIIHVPGHVSKAAAIGYMAFLVAGVLQTYRGKYLLGGTLTAFFMALEVNANHYQISYYIAIAFLLFGIVYFIDAVRNKTLPHFFKASGIVVLAALLGAGPSIGRVWTSAEYAPVTMRGGSELPADDASDTGLQKEYAFLWSYGIDETFNLMVPNFKGGASNTFDPKSKEYRELTQAGGAQFANQIREYWGEQNGTSGPVYVGAIVCFLFILGIILVQGPLKWWLLSLTILSILLAWGSNSFLASLFFDYFPLYNKFRAPSMLLVLAEFSMPFLGILGLKELMTADLKEHGQKLKRALFISVGITAGLSLLFFLATGLFADFLSSVEESANLPNQVLDPIIAYREALFKADALRSAGLILAAGSLILFYLRGALKPMAVFGGLALLIIVDMVPVNARYLDMDKKDFLVAETKFDNTFIPTAADTYILQDKDPNFRVLNLTANLAYDKVTPYHHKSVGGYHAAKMRRYQDLIDTVLFAETRRIGNHLQGGQVTDSSILAMMNQNTGLNMLNTRYVIYNPGAPALQNNAALGNAWFVNTLKEVNSPQEEILALRRLNARTTAVVDKNYDDGRFAEVLGGAINNDPSATITLTEYSPRRIKYTANRQGEGLAVFSEIYYNDGKGWTAYINGEAVPHGRVNYVLRALRVPSGQSEIEFRFDPTSYTVGNTIGMITSLLVFLLLGLGIFLEWKSSQKKDEEVSA